ncbi:MAG: hypothetical protein HC853_17315 [Anaerolineae bacterium]|nr:hypothetical protein [Anaerolineae bacterium]
MIDVDLCAMADPVGDVALLMARMVAMPFMLDISHADANAASDAFFEAYFASVPTAWRARLPVALAGALLNVAASFCRRAEPNWRDVSQALMAKAQEQYNSRS